MKKLLILVALATSFFASVIYAAVQYGEHKTADNALPVTASFYPMAEFVRQVGGTHVSVTTLVKPGVEPHDYDPSPQDVATIYASKMVVYNGAGLEAWEPHIDRDLKAQHIVVVQASQGINLHPLEADGSSGSSSNDPHVWMDPVLAVREVNAIRDGLIKADPAHAADYRANAKAYNAKLQDLNLTFKNGLQQCQLRTIVTSHQAFSYLAAEYNLTAYAVAGLSPDNEPSPQKLAEIATIVRQQSVGYVFFETLVSPKLSQTIARETGAKAIAFNPLEGLTHDEVARGDNYISVQKANLQALRTALHCK